MSERIVLDQPPEVRILSPGSGDCVPAGTSVEATGEATDADGDDLELGWTLDGRAIGTGSRVLFTVAEPGEHELRLCVTQTTRCATTVCTSVRVQVSELSVKVTRAAIVAGHIDDDVHTTPVILRGCPRTTASVTLEGGEGTTPGSGASLRIGGGEATPGTSLMVAFGQEGMIEGRLVSSDKLGSTRIVLTEAGPTPRRAEAIVVFVRPDARLEVALRACQSLTPSRGKVPVALDVRLSSEDRAVDRHALTLRLAGAVDECARPIDAAALGDFIELDATVRETAGGMASFVSHVLKEGAFDLEVVDRTAFDRDGSPLVYGPPAHAVVQEPDELEITTGAGVVLSQGQLLRLSQCDPALASVTLVARGRDHGFDCRRDDQDHLADIEALWHVRPPGSEAVLLTPLTADSIGVPRVTLSARSPGEATLVVSARTCLGKRLGSVLRVETFPGPELTVFGGELFGTLRSGPVVVSAVGSGLPSAQIGRSFRPLRAGESFEVMTDAAPAGGVLSVAVDPPEGILRVTQFGPVHDLRRSQRQSLTLEGVRRGTARIQFGYTITGAPVGSASGPRAALAALGGVPVRCVAIVSAQITVEAPCDLVEFEKAPPPLIMMPVSEATQDRIKGIHTFTVRVRRPAKERLPRLTLELDGPLLQDGVTLEGGPTVNVAYEKDVMVLLHAGPSLAAGRLLFKADKQVCDRASPQVRVFTLKPSEVKSLKGIEVRQFDPGSGGHDKPTFWSDPNLDGSPDRPDAPVVVGHTRVAVMGLDTLLVLKLKEGLPSPATVDLNVEIRAPDGTLTLRASGVVLGAGSTKQSLAVGLRGSPSPENVALVGPATVMWGITGGPIQPRQRHAVSRSHLFAVTWDSPAAAEVLYDLSLIKSTEFLEGMGLGAQAPAVAETLMHRLHSTQGLNYEPFAVFLMPPDDMKLLEPARFGRSSACFDFANLLTRLMRTQGLAARMVVFYFTLNFPDLGEKAYLAGDRENMIIPRAQALGVRKPPYRFGSHAVSRLDDLLYDAVFNKAYANPTARDALEAQPCPGAQLIVNPEPTGSPYHQTIMTFIEAKHLIRVDGGIFHRIKECPSR